MAAFMHWAYRASGDSAVGRGVSARLQLTTLDRTVEAHACALGQCVAQLLSPAWRENA